ncbi:MAG: prephenate dehydrogenase/arogenate dehydrogenase family protein [Candidatus Bathyarchaeia archaeon]
MRFPEDLRILPKGVIAIAGGSGGMGRTMAKLLKPTGASIRLCGRSVEKAKRAAKRMGLDHGGLEDVHDAEILVLAVPFEEVVNVYERVAGRLSPRALIVDIASVKTPLVGHLSKLLGVGMEYLSLHPLFGPSTRRFKGQRMLAVDVKVGGKSKLLKEYFKKLGLIVTETTADEHDRMMAIAQVAHHFSMMSLLRVLVEHPLPSGFTSRSLHETVLRLRRMGKGVRTMLEIQRYNPYAAEMRRRYVETASRLSAMDDQAVEAVMDGLRRLREHPLNQP